MRRTLRIIAWLGLVTSVSACGGSAPEAKEPEPSSESGPAPEATDEKSSGGEEKAEGSGAKEEPKAEAPASTPVRTAKDLVTRDDVLFVFKFNASEAHDVAEKKCNEKAGDDPKKKADCMSKASSAVEADSITFEQDADEKWWWLTVRRKGDKLVTLHKVQVEFADDKEKSVTLKPQGPDKGSQPMRAIPKELVIEIPSESEIAIRDPKHGRMVYEAKLGLKGDQQR